MHGEYDANLVELIQRERQLVSAVESARRRLERIDEELAEEDRAEMYTILQALRNDAEFSGRALSSLLGR